MRYTQREFIQLLETKLKSEVCPIRIAQLEMKIFKLKMESAAMV
jgi:hypothetical protein